MCEFKIYKIKFVFMYSIILVIVYNKLMKLISRLLLSYEQRVRF